MRILFLDDDRNRFLEFSELILELRKKGEIGEVDIKWALQAKMAKHFLEEIPRFDVAFLDHDLAPAHYEGTISDLEEDGKDVARAIAAMPEAERPWHCHVHSWNYGGAKEMETILEEAKVHTTQAMFPRGIEDVLAAVWAIRGGRG